jgi:hypothetical protein
MTANERAAPRQGPPRNVQTPAGDERLPTVAQRCDELALRRELRAWALAVRYLNACGLAAAVPARLVGPLRRRGLTVWPVLGRDAA